jgi:hypothetical protein
MEPPCHRESGQDCECSIKQQGEQEMKEWPGEPREEECKKCARNDHCGHNDERIDGICANFMSAARLKRLDEIGEKEEENEEE